MAAMTDGRRVKFGIFEADLSARKLWKRGSLVHLQDKPFQLLSFLLDRRGEVVTREELRNRLWSQDTFVEFDEGVNAAVGKVRFALKDSADNPIFFETVRGKGYRWIAPVEVVGSTDGRPQTDSPSADGSDSVASTSLQKTTHAHASNSSALTIGLIITAAVSLILGLSYVSTQHKADVHVDLVRLPIKQRQLTTNSRDNPVSANAISPDGTYLAYADVKGLHIQRTSTGETRDVPNPAPYETAFVYWGIPQNWLPDGTGFLANTNPPYQPLSTWVVSLLGGAPRKLRDDWSPWSISAEGHIAYTTHTDREIWVTDDDGQHPRKILAVGGSNAVSMLVWSPDGRRLGYINDHDDAALNTTTIDAVDVRTGVVTTLVPSPLLRDLSRLPADLRSLIWLPDGRVMYSTGVRDSNGYSCNYWAIHGRFRSDRIDDCADTRDELGWKLPDQCGRNGKRQANRVSENNGTSSRVHRNV